MQTAGILEWHGVNKMATIKIDVGDMAPCTEMRLSRYMQLMQIGLVVRRPMDRSIVGKIIGFSKRGYGWVDVECIPRNTSGRITYKNNLLYDWEIVYEN